MRWINIWRSPRRWGWGGRRSSLRFPRMMPTGNLSPIYCRKVRGMRYFCRGRNWETKRWPPDKFAQCVGPLRKRYGMECVVAGGAGDSVLAAQIPGVRDLTGKTNLRQLIALLERAELVIANDTGPMHIASALGRPLVSIYGPTSPARTGPYGRLAPSCTRYPMQPLLRPHVFQSFSNGLHEKSASQRESSRWPTNNCRRPCPACERRRCA